MQDVGMTRIQFNQRFRGHITEEKQSDNKYHQHFRQGACAGAKRKLNFIEQFDKAKEPP